MMPDWLSVTIDKGFTLGFAVAVLFAIARASRFLAPKVTQVVESHSGLIESLKTNGQTTTECLQRQTAMMHNLGQTLDGHGNILDRHGERLENVEEKLTDIHERVVVRGCGGQAPVPGGKSA